MSGLELVQQFALNLADNLLPVNLAVSAVCAAVGVISWRKRDFGHAPQSFGSDGYRNSSWRMWVSAQTTAVVWLAWVAVNSVPAPDYKIKRVEVRVPVKVSTMGTYLEAMNACKELDEGAFTDEDRQFCDQRALVLTRPGMFIERTVFRDREVVKREHDPYQQLYDRCMAHYKTVYADRESLETNIMDRMGRCHSQALEARRD